MVFGLLCLPGRGHCNGWFKHQAWMENSSRTPVPPRQLGPPHSSFCQNMQANMQNMHIPNFWQINIHLTHEWRDKNVYRQQQLFCDHRSNEQQTAFWLPPGVRETLNTNCPILKGFVSFLSFFFFFFYQTGHHLQPIDGLFLRNESLLDRCLVSLVLSLTPRLHPHLRWHFLT